MLQDNIKHSPLCRSSSSWSHFTHLGNDIQVQWGHSNPHAHTRPYIQDHVWNSRTHPDTHTHRHWPVRSYWGWQRVQTPRPGPRRQWVRAAPCWCKKSECVGSNPAGCPRSSPWRCLPPPYTRHTNNDKKTNQMTRASGTSDVDVLRLTTNWR